MATARYSVKVLWIAEHAPGWEIETAHPGFASPAEAALFANGFDDLSPARLDIERGTVGLHLSSAFAPTPDDEVDRAQRTARLATGIIVSWSAGDHPDMDGEAIRAQPAIAGLTLTLWKLRPHGEVQVADVELVGDADFELMPYVAAGDLVAQDLTGTWLPHGYEVTGPEGHIEVAIEFDELTGSLSVEVSDRDPREAADPILTVVPKA